MQSFRRVRVLILAGVVFVVSTLPSDVDPVSAEAGIGASTQAGRRPSSRARLGRSSRFYRSSIGYYHGPFVGGFYYPPHAGAYGATWIVTRDHGSLRLEVAPKAAEVYVDGYFAGNVDDFDGFFQRLHVDSGEHALTLYLEGYETVTQQLFVNAGSSLKIKHEMVRLVDGETSSLPPPPEEIAPGPMHADPAMLASTVRPPQRGRDRTPGQFGLLVLRIRPVGAQVLIDGEPWSSLGDDETIAIHLPSGRHELEIRESGYESFHTEVEIRAGRDTKLNVQLPSSREASFRVPRPLL